MSYIPDTREMYDALAKAYGKKKLNPYWEKFLNDRDKDRVLEYDFATEQGKSFFENQDKEDYGISEEDWECLVESFEEWMESSRDEMIVSLIDSMDVEEYERIKKAVYEKEGITDDAG